jgi:hypothetical protein
MALTSPYGIANSYFEQNASLATPSPGQPVSQSPSTHAPLQIVQQGGFFRNTHAWLHDGARYTPTTMSGKTAYPTALTAGHDYNPQLGPGHFY